MAKKKGVGTASKAWDLSKLKTDTVNPSTELDRVHPEQYGAAQFNASGKGDARFSPIWDASGKVIPTMYAAKTFHAALMETAFHDVPNQPGKKIVSTAKLKPLHRARLKVTQPLKVADLTSIGLKNLNTNKAEVIESPPDAYPLTRTLAKAIHAHDDTIQGVQWVSKQDDRAMSFMFFGDRIADGTFDPIIKEHPIMDGQEFVEMMDLADKIDVLLGD